MKKTMLTLAFGLVVGLLSITGMQAAPAETGTDWAKLSRGAAVSFGLTDVTAQDFAVWKLAINAAVNRVLQENLNSQGTKVPTSDRALKYVKRAGQWLAYALATAEDEQERQGLTCVAALARRALEVRGDASLTKAFLTGYNSVPTVTLNFVELDDVMRAAAPAAGTY